MRDMERFLVIIVISLICSCSKSSSINKLVFTENDRELKLNEKEFIVNKKEGIFKIKIINEEKFFEIKKLYKPIIFLNYNEKK